MTQLTTTTTETQVDGGGNNAPQETLLSVAEFRELIDSPTSCVLIKSKIHAGRAAVDTIIKSNPKSGTKRVKFHLPPLNPKPPNALNTRQMASHIHLDVAAEDLDGTEEALPSSQQGSRTSRNRSNGSFDALVLAMRQEWKSLCWLIVLMTLVSIGVALIVYFFPPKHVPTTDQH